MRRGDGHVVIEELSATLGSAEDDNRIGGVAQRGGIELQAAAGDGDRANKVVGGVFELQPAAVGNTAGVRAADKRQSHVAGDLRVERDVAVGVLDDEDQILPVTGSYCAAGDRFVVGIGAQDAAGGDRERIGEC